MKNVICSKVLWRGLLLFLVLTSSVGLAEKANVNMKQMENEQLIELFASPKYKDGSKALDEILNRIAKSNYDEHSELAKLLFHYWRESDNEKIRSRCFQGLRWTKSQAVVDVLTSQLLHGSTRAERRRAAWYLRQIASATAVPALEAAVRADKGGGFVEGRTIAQYSIIALGLTGGPAVPVLIKIWNDESLRVGCECGLLAAMGYTGDVRVVPILVKALNSKDESIRSSAAAALGIIGNKKMVFGKKREHLNAPDKRTLRSILLRLKQRQNDPNESVRENVLEAINKIEKRIQGKSR